MAVKGDHPRSPSCEWENDSWWNKEQGYYQKGIRNVNNFYVNKKL